MDNKKANLDQLRKIVKEEVLKEMGDVQKAKAIHDVIVDIAKAASVGMKAVESLKSKAMPTEKATQAVSSAITALEHIFHDMSTNPTRYLDQDPQALVQQHVGSLDDREAALKANVGGGSGDPFNG